MSPTHIHTHRHTHRHPHIGPCRHKQETELARRERDLGTPASPAPLLLSRRPSEAAVVFAVAITNFAIEASF